MSDLTEFLFGPDRRGMGFHSWRCGAQNTTHHVFICNSGPPYGTFLFMQPGPTSSDRIAANVRAELAARRISQKQMAQALGWSEAKVSRLVSGRGTWDVDDAEAVAVRVFTMVDVTPLLAHRVTV